jgi:zinc-ribbon domain
MSGTSCPSCDAPARPGARTCARCGYRFLEDGPTPRRPPTRPLLVAGGVAALAVAVVGVAIATSGGADQPTAAPPANRLQVVSDRPLSTRAAEALLEERYTALRDDDSAAVSCSGREAKPAHSVRRCEVRYSNGAERRVVLLTNARGNEVLSKP